MIVRAMSAATRCWRMSGLLTDLRGTNRAYRVRGDEFCSILEDMEGTSAVSALERVRAAIDEETNGVTLRHRPEYKRKRNYLSGRID